MISNDIIHPITILVGIDTSNHNAWTCLESLAELKELAKTADLQTVDSLIQKREKAHSRYYIGTGKIEELKALVETHKATLIVTDDELTPGQQKNLEEYLSIKVTDRTGLILDIFARRAQTREAQLQVELAQLTYIRPRLTRMWQHLSRLGGGIGTRGPGETQLETDKRQVDQRIILIKTKIEKIKTQRGILRKNRTILPILTGALVGYTNAGKSTLLNQLTEAEVFVEDKLFATLDPTTRKLQLPNHETVLLSDTVGFIQKLPHQLVNSFRTTIEEITQANFILHIVDMSHPNYEGMLNTAEKTLKELEIKDVPILMVFNKIDRCKDITLDKIRLTERFPHSVFISATKKGNLTDLRLALIQLLDSYRETITFNIPYSRMDIVNLLHQYGHIIEEAYETNITITTAINRIIGNKIMGMLG